MIRSLLLAILFLCFILDLFIIGFQWSNDLRFVTKPLLIPLLAIYYRYSTTQVNKLFLAGLVMSFFGDLFLIFSGGFIAGLSCFLVAHILYILTFKAFFKKSHLASIPLISGAVIGLIIFLFPHLGSLKVPVILYAFTIGVMLYVAIGTGKKWIIVGALLFVLSDAILSVNLFYHRSVLGSLSVMIAYMLAQFLLVKGMIIQDK